VLGIILSKVKKVGYTIGSLRWKLFMSHLLICFVPLMFFSNTLASSMEDYFSSERAKELTKYGNYVAGKIAQFQALTEPNTYLKIKQDIRTKVDDWVVNRILIIDSHFFVFMDSANSLEGTILASADVMSVLSGNSKYSLSSEKTKMYASAPIIGTEEGVIGSVLIVSDIDEINYMLSKISQKLFLTATLLAFIVAVLVFFISQILIDPLKEIRGAVTKMAAGGFSHRINMTGHDEFAEVATAFNEMSSELERVEMTRQEFVSNVSHELKTPLSSMKVLSESLLLQDAAPKELYIEFLQDITSEIDRMTRIINELLTLVKLDRTDSPLNIQETDLSKILEEIVKRILPLSNRRNIKLELIPVPSLKILADEMKLSLAFTNLIENAVKYNHDGGNVRVSAEADRMNVFVTIADDGIGIPEIEQSKVFARFYRVDKTRHRETGGTGLGLSITQKIILLHDGSIKLISKENEGSTFIVRIPNRISSKII
jgi:signal transduction histidine kinase